MPTVTWTPAFDTGIKAIDRQHHELIELLNELILARESGQQAVADDLFPRLTAYVLFHFSTEETLLTQSPEHAAHRAMHLQQHQDFGKKIADWRARPEASLHDEMDDIIAYLKDWLLGHIQGTDKTLARILQARADGT